jgi:uncharacterized protein YjbJ (UPF0337 family)
VAEVDRRRVREDVPMSIWGKAKGKAEELYGRAEELYGKSHGDAAAEVRGEAHVVEGEAEEGHDREAAAAEEALGHGPAAEQLGPADDDGLTGAR